MKVVQSAAVSEGIKLTILDEQSRVVGRAFLYILHNDLHEQPFGLLEDVFVEEVARGQGLGSDLVRRVIELAKKSGCYKLVATSRYSRDKVHKLYRQLGFIDHGREFRTDF